MTYCKAMQVYIRGFIVWFNCPIHNAVKDASHSATTFQDAGVQYFREIQKLNTAVSPNACSSGRVR